MFHLPRETKRQVLKTKPLKFQTEVGNEIRFAFLKMNLVWFGLFFRNKKDVKKSGVSEKILN